MGQKRTLQSLIGSCAYAALLCLLGCGYQFAGRSELFPKDIHSVYVEPFLNRTRDVGLGSELTTAVRGELYRRGELQHRGPGGSSGCYLERGRAFFRQPDVVGQHRCRGPAI